MAIDGICHNLHNSALSVTSKYRTLMFILFPLLRHLKGAQFGREERYRKNSLPVTIRCPGLISKAPAEFPRALDWSFAHRVLQREGVKGMLVLHRNRSRKFTPYFNYLDFKSEVWIQLESINKEQKYSINPGDGIRNQAVLRTQ